MFYRRNYLFNVTGREQVIGQVGAYSPWNSKLWFSVVGTDDVTIDRQSGTLYAVTNLVQDQVKPYMFYAVVTDNHYKSATVAVNLNVTSSGVPPPDKPNFWTSSYTTAVSSNLTVNSTVLRVYASGLGGEQVVYSLLNSSYFNVNWTSGYVYLTRPLGNTTYHNFTVTAAYQSTPQVRSFAPVFVSVRNTTIQSSALTLQNSGMIQVYNDIPRDGHVTTIRAVAKDPSQQNLVKYYLNDSSSLRIDEYTGDVYVHRLPLLQRTSVYLTATLGTVSVGTRLIVNKVCHPNEPIASCLMDPCMSPIQDPVSNCPEMQGAACLANYCGGCNAEFYKNGHLVVCSVKPTPIPSTIRPIFTSPHYRIRLASNQTTTGSIVGQVYASVPVGEVVIYSAVNTTYFGVDRLTGSLYVTRPLKNMTSHTFTVMASFQSTPNNMSVAYVHVEILPDNSLTLSFPKRWYTVNVLANISRGGLVTMMTATASSMQDQVRYAIRGSDTIGINEFTGAVYILALPLYNQTLLVNVVATVGNLSTSAILEISKVCALQQPIAMCAVDPCKALPECALRSNATCVASFCGDCRAEYFANGDRLRCESSTAPQVDETIYETRVYENQPVGVKIASLYELGVPFLPLPSSALEFTIDSGGFGVFNISRAGSIILASSPDYEKKQDYHLVVRAILSGLTSVSTSRTLITVHIINVNDNVPEFKAVMSPFIVPSDLTAGDMVFRFWATDADLQDKVSYELLGGESSIFNLDSLSGVVTLKTTIPEGRYSLKVRATDTGLPSSSTITSVDILSESRTSGYPIFPYRVAEFRKVESSPVNSLIKTIPASGGSKFTYQEVVGF
ncbi:fat-like cadherin-related tumor suppressor homolog [Liolophura sinensis]|uniref:fat-like cadherin-related tumor suppressor homolog n=1 Tax=Liolophura sinensis TaxID=3198878 RepID=UPI003158D1B0